MNNQITTELNIYFQYSNYVIDVVCLFVLFQSFFNLMFNKPKGITIYERKTELKIMNPPNIRLEPERQTVRPGKRLDQSLPMCFRNKIM